uniref:Potassium transporter TrkA n=1 Tax=Schistosoma curassoni TaxID=6186 RepID=A0A183JNS0_9TREM
MIILLGKKGHTFLCAALFCKHNSSVLIGLTGEDVL